MVNGTHSNDISGMVENTKKAIDSKTGIQNTMAALKATNTKLPDFNSRPEAIGRGKD